MGSLTQLGTIRLGKRTEGRTPSIKSFVPLSGLNDLVFAGWDIFTDNAYQSAANAGVLNLQDLGKVKPFLSTIKPMKAAFDHNFVKMIDGPNIKKGKNKYELALQIKEDIAKFRKSSGASRLVTCWCGSTESFLKPEEVHSTPEKFEAGDESESPGDRAFDAVCVGVGDQRGAVRQWLAEPERGYSGDPKAGALKHEVAICGKDFKTGQTLMKTVLAPAFKARMLGLDGWFSTNILGNRDGEVLEDPGSFKTKEESKLGALEYILQPELYPELYGKMYHKVRINYYPPRGDNKEGWDNIDIFGWLGYPMQIKVDFLCRDSILAAPIVLDLVLFLDLAQRAGLRGIQEWLSFYFKSPMTAPGLYPEHDLFIQSMKLKNTLRWMMGEELITHLGQEYYD